MTVYDVKHILTKREYMSFIQFLSNYIEPNGTKQVIVSMKNKKYSSGISIMNTYKISDVIEKAKERVEVVKAGRLRKTTLCKVINYYKEKQK